jgi:superfamily II DNA/RNA helicase
VREILDRLEVEFGRDGFVDVLLASNMISVGVDISRLGLMVVNGQPKTMSEYIQSTSRVGRGEVPGIVVTLFNDAKARDRSRFETFRTWHSTIYRDVEATSVTPFSSRARDKALHAALIGMVRHLCAAMTERPTNVTANRAQIEGFADLIERRAKSVDAEEASAVTTELIDIINNWEGRTGLKAYWNDYQVNTSLLISAEEAAKRRAMGRAPGLAIPTPNSMRNVEPSTIFVLLENLSDRG